VPPPFSASSGVADGAGASIDFSKANLFDFPSSSSSDRAKSDVSNNGNGHHQQGEDSKRSDKNE
jgi:hypothetical protein